jgi:NNP family nitrate/nitrite transporter-like MFS transporter
MPTRALNPSLEQRPQSALPFPLLPVVFLTTIFYLNFTSRVMFSPLLPVLEREMGLGHGEAGSLFFLLQIGYCVGLLGSGFVAWRLNHRRTILLSTLALGVVLLILSQVTSIAGIRAGLVVLGALAGLYLPSGIATLTGEIPQEHWGKALAVHELAPNLGYISAPLLAEALLRLLPWRGVLAAPAVLAILIGICFMLFGRGGGHRSEPPSFTTMIQLVRDPSLWILASLFTVGIGSSLGVYSMTPLFLVSEIGMKREVANVIAGLSRIPGIVVIFFSGLVTDRIGHRRALAFFLVVTGSLTLLLGVLHGRVITPALVFLQSASAGWFFPAGFSMISVIFPARVRSLAVSMIIVVGSLLGGGLIPSGIGYLAEISSFSFGFSLLGLLTFAMLPLVLSRRGSTGPDITSGRTGNPRA